MADLAIEVRGLRRDYGDVHAVDGIDLDVHAVDGIDLDVRTGEILAFLGPNGAGKTTTAEILEGFRQRSAGEVRVLGADPSASRAPSGRDSAASCRRGSWRDG